MGFVAIAIGLIIGTAVSGSDSESGFLVVRLFWINGVDWVLGSSSSSSSVEDPSSSSEEVTSSEEEAAG
ncbi:hypothetical protein ES332_A05G241400v1 [Gossypium tomentosum]|uniref:Secreted protein n=1 Tax=Gossypium tomentosum TaxID=34277 RepID=A0A5D2QID3_GOSTO|nr:hypothetical protein ES332_A05G241400v1 [Gossypium tomentosum]